jgi:putative ATPase
MNLDLFSNPSGQDLPAKGDMDEGTPLAERMRPRTFEEFVGQQELLGPEKPLRRLLERGEAISMILWGPPGCGKTTLAKMIANYTQATFVEISAVASGVADLRNIVGQASERKRIQEKRTILFIDEIHRFNKGQQDFLLPYVEQGTVTCIGATTENPSFEVNSALLSRARVFVLKKLESSDIVDLIRRALTDPERGLGKKNISLSDDALWQLAEFVDGDARQALNALEAAVRMQEAKKKGARTIITLQDLSLIFQRSHLLYDKKGEEHYHTISALHKSMRGSDPDASLYWLGRMLEAGEDPLYVARRLVRFASEDIGLADPQALIQAVAAFQAAHMLGLPECNVSLAQAVVYLSLAPKSNQLYEAYSAVRQDIQERPNDPIPLHIRNAPTKLMKELGYGKGYVYPPSAKGPIKQSYLPERLKHRKYWNK